MEWLRLKPVPKWDAGTTDGDNVLCHTLAPRCIINTALLIRLSRGFSVSYIFETMMKLSYSVRYLPKCNGTKNCLLVMTSEVLLRTLWLVSCLCL